VGFYRGHADRQMDIVFFEIHGEEQTTILMITLFLFLLLNWSAQLFKTDLPKLIFVLDKDVPI